MGLKSKLVSSEMLICENLSLETKDFRKKIQKFQNFPPKLPSRTFWLSIFVSENESRKPYGANGREKLRERRKKNLKGQTVFKGSLGRGIKKVKKVKKEIFVMPRRVVFLGEMEPNVHQSMGKKQRKINIHRMDGGWSRGLLRKGGACPFSKNVWCINE